MMAAMAGADIVDVAFNSMAGLTSQPALNSIVAAMEGTERETGLPVDGLQTISTYWDAVRPVYSQFESELKSGTAEIYKYEMPGGQYSNLRSQVPVSYTHLDVYKRQGKGYIIINDLSLFQGKIYSVRCILNFRIGFNNLQVTRKCSDSLLK